MNLVTLFLQMKKVSLDPAKRSMSSSTDKPPVSEQSPRPTPQAKPVLQEKPVPQVKPVLQEKAAPQVKPVLQEKPAPQVKPALEEKPKLVEKPVDKSLVVRLILAHLSIVYWMEL